MTLVGSIKWNKTVKGSSLFLKEMDGFVYERKKHIKEFDESQNIGPVKYENPLNF